MEKIGVVTVTYNSAEVIQPFLENLFAQTFTNFNLYVIDNNSKDATLKILDIIDDSSFFLVKNNKNLGVAAANNIGIKKALKDKCSHVLLINNDVEFPRSLFKDMLLSIRQNKSSLLAPKVLYHYDNNIIWYAGGGFNKSNGYLPYHSGFNKKNSDSKYKSCTVEYASTCCLLIDKSVFDDIGFMDEKYFVYFDDTDYLFRLKKHGKHSVFYDSNISLTHKVGSLTKSIVKSKEESIYRTNFFLQQNIRNHVYFLRKNGGLYCYFFCVFLLLKNNLRFLFSRRIKKDISTFVLINRSYFQGWFL